MQTVNIDLKFKLHTHVYAIEEKNRIIQCPCCYDYKKASTAKYVTKEVFLTGATLRFSAKEPRP